LIAEWQHGQKIITDFDGRKIVGVLGEDKDKDGNQDLTYLNSDYFANGSLVGSQSLSAEEQEYVLNNGILYTNAELNSSNGLLGGITALSNQPNTVDEFGNTVLVLGTGNRVIGDIRRDTRYATNKNSRFMPKLKAIADEFDLSLDGAWNK
jgi:hypothetical protein